MFVNDFSKQAFMCPVRIISVTEHIGSMERYFIYIITESILINNFKTYKFDLLLG